MNDEFINDDIYLEATKVLDSSYIMRDKLYPKISEVLSTSVGDRKFKQAVGNFMDRNNEKLHTSGPVYMIPFGDADKALFFSIFNIKSKEVVDLTKEVIKKLNSASDFKLLTNNPIFWVFYLCIRYYHMKKDIKGVNTALSIYALSVYPSIFSVFFKYGANEAVMQYTMDNLTDKFILKQGGHLFGGLFLSINHSYAFLKQFMNDASDAEIIRFIQRIRNDQKSILKNICDIYMKNYAAGKRVKLSKDSFGEVQIDDANDNNTSLVELLTNNITNMIITNGLDLNRVNQCKNLTGISLADCRFYLSKIVTDKYTKEIQNFIHSILFLYIYTEHKTKQDINSSHFLVWSSDLFRRTNSNEPNINTIKKTLEKWGVESGVHSKFHREASRITYKRAIFWYFVLSIQYYR